MGPASLLGTWWQWQPGHITCLGRGCGLAGATRGHAEGEESLLACLSTLFHCGLLPFPKLSVWNRMGSTGTCTSSHVLSIIAFRSPMSSLIFNYADVESSLQRD